MGMRDIFIKHDERREQWRVQPMGWVAAVLVAILTASVTSGVWHSLAGPRLRITPTVPPTAVAEALDTGPRPTATAIVRTGCPTDPALWELVPYTLPGSETVLYAIDPPCVMEQVEQAFAECTNLKANRGRHWADEDEEMCYSTSGFTTILGNEEVLPLAPGWPAYGQCLEVMKADGTPLTSVDLHFVFYTISQDKRVANLLVVNDVHPTVRTYDCETGELIEETSGDPTQTAVVYYPLLYEDGRWRMGYRHDVGNLVPADEIDAQAMANIVLHAQGHLP